LKRRTDESFTPKQVAVALQVSESSVKRWCDRGDIRTDRTLGGHRRIPLDFLLEFLESTNRRVVIPAAIGLEKRVFDSPERRDASVLDEAAMLQLFEASLISGDESECRKIISAWFAVHGGIASVADNLLSPTFRKIGQKWACGDMDVYEERHSGEICNRLIQELRRLLPEPQGFAPLAMGGTSSGDPYTLPNQLVEMVFREFGWRTMGLGVNLPFSSLLSAARKHMPRLFWLSVSHVEDTELFLEGYNHFSRSLPKGILLVVGGTAITAELRPRMAFSSYCDNLLQLSSLAKSLRVNIQMPSRPI